MFIDGIKKCHLCAMVQSCSHTSSEKKQAQKLLEFSDEFFLEQYIRKPTRNQNILDLCFTNDHFLIHNYQIIVNSKLSDHFTICVNLNYDKIVQPESKKKKNSIPEYDLKVGDDEDWSRLNLLLNKVNWETILEGLSPEESLMTLLKVLEENVPLVFSKHKDFLEESQDHPGGRFKNNNKIPRKSEPL